jgi:acylpyruvate hydrolase
MRLATVGQAGGTRAVRVEGEEGVVLPFADVGELLGSGADWRTSARQDGPRIPLADAAFGRLVPQPSKVWCVGRNYLEHIREGNPDAEPPRFPELFVKFADSLTGPYQDIPLPAGSGADFPEAIAAAAKAPAVAVPPV